jgi:AAA15 family ATPase/GTPase
MYTSFEIKNFRILRKLSLNQLGRINLIAGRNNVGKTTLLEAIWIQFVRLNIFRGLQKMDFSSTGTNVPDVWWAIFSNFDTEKKIELTSSRKNVGKEVVTIRYINEGQELRKIQTIQNAEIDRSATHSPDILAALEMKYERATRQPIMSYGILSSTGLNFQPAFRPDLVAIFINGRTFNVEELANQFGELVKQGQRSVLVDALRIIEPSIESIELLAFSGQVMLWGSLKNGTSTPLSFMGEGINLLARLICAVSFAKNGVVCIDEIENGFHYSIQKDVWKAIHKAAVDFNVQIFATTHSYECIMAAHAAHREIGATDDFNFIRLERTRSGNTQSLVYDDEAIEGTIGMELEVR